MSDEFLASFSAALGITAPIFIIVVLGIAIKRLRLIHDAFIESASKVVFNLGLPCLLFITIIKTDLNTVFNVQLILVGLGSTLLIFLVLVAVSTGIVKVKRERGIFVQGSFRGNMGIIGLAFCLNAYGQTGIALASVYMACLTILYNLLSVVTLTHSLRSDQQSFGRQVIVSIFKNPIVISIVLGFLVVGIKLPLHPILVQSGEYLAQMTLPLALLCIGGSINLKELRQSSFVSIATVTMKLAIVPTASVLLALPFNFSPMELGVVYLMAASPTATASYIMVKAMNGNGVLAANIVVVSTLASVFTGSIGIVLLRGFQLI